MPPRIQIVSHGPHCLDGVTAAAAVARFFDVSLPITRMISLAVALLVIFALHLFLTRTYLGKGIRATAEDWLANFDRNLAKIDPILRKTYAADAPLWRRRWRLFFLATSGLFGYTQGDAWGVHHYRLRAA